MINQYEPKYGEEEKKAVFDYLSSGGWLTEFKKTKEFEKMICDFTGAKYCSVVSNGTIAIFLALKAIDIGPGDEVIVPDFTMAATANAVILTGASPVFVEIEEESLCLDLDKVKEAMSENTKAVIHVSLNGKAGDIEGLRELCKEKNIHLIEDAAQSLGSLHNGKHLGTFGILGTLSFSMPKIITTGQGGAVITDDEDLYKKVKKIKDFGRSKGGIDLHDIVGWNFKFTDIQASIGVEQFKKLEKRIQRKKEMFKLYKKMLKNVKQVEFIETDLENTTPWFMDIFVSQRDELMKYLLEKEIDTRPVYPALHTQKAYEGSCLVKKLNSYPITDKMTNKGLWLPSSLTLTNEQIIYICEEIKKFYESNSTNTSP